MEAYESIIDRVVIMLDTIEYDIKNERKDRNLIYEDLNNVIKISIDTKNFFKQMYYEQRQNIIAEQIQLDQADIIFEKLTDCIARGTFLKSIILK